MERYLDFVGRFPKTIILALVSITLYLGYMSGYLTEDSNPYLLPEDHPARANLLEMREDFTGTYDSILIAVHNKDGVFNPESLKALYELTERSRKLTFSTEADVQRVQQLIDRYRGDRAPGQVGDSGGAVRAASRQDAGGGKLARELEAVISDGLDQQDGRPLRRLASQAADWDIRALDKKYLRVLAERVDPVRELAGMAATENLFLEADGTLRAAVTLNTADPDVEKVRKAIIDNELMEMGVVDRDGKVGLLVIEISVLQDDAEGQLRAYEAVNQMIADYQAANPEFTDEVHVGGVPVFFAEQKKIMDADMSILLPMVLLLITLVLAAFFRRFLGVVIPLVNVVMCTLWTMGGMAIVGIPLDLITAVLPVFLITICSSDAIHVMAEYYYQRNNRGSNREAVRAAMRLMVSPVILTTLTTCVTFSLSTTTSISNLKNFGYCMSFGMFVAMIISLLLIPAWLSLLGDGKLKSVASGQRKSYLISRLLQRCVANVAGHRKAYLAGFLSIVAVLGYVATQVSIDDMGSGYFEPDNRFRAADDFINAHVAGTSPGWIEIDTGKVNGMKTVEAVEFIDRLEKFIHQQEHISFSYSLARYVRRIMYVMNDMGPAYNRLPRKKDIVEAVGDDGAASRVAVDGDTLVDQAVLLYEMGGGTDLTNVLSEDFSKSVLLYTMNTTVASDYEAFLEKLDTWLAENTPEGISYKLAGSPVIWTAVLDELISGQLLSIGLAFLSVILVMSLWLKSPRLGLVGTLPLAVTVIAYYAMMTLFNIELNIGTAIISFLVLGVVDYSVHYLLRTRYYLRQKQPLDEALLNAVAHSGRSIIANVFVFSIGFVALLFSDFKPIVDLGSLVGMSLFISGVMSLFVITLLAPWLIPSEQGVSEAPAEGIMAKA